MKKSWKQIRTDIIENVKEIFLGSNDPKYQDSEIEESADLLYNVLQHKTGVKKLDGLNDSILDAIYEVYNTKPGKYNPTENIINNIEPFLKKIIFILKGDDHTEDRAKNLMWCLKNSNVLISNLTLNKEKIDDYVGESNFAEHVCRTFVFRNELHNAPALRKAEAYQYVESGLVVYMFSILQNKTELTEKVGETVALDILEENYKKFVTSVLSSNPSIKMLESEFGVKIKSLEDFDVKIKAKAKQIEAIKGEYLKNGKKHITPPIKFLPDIEGVMKSPKFLIIHGIATSGKSTTLKKLGKDFLKKYNNPYVFYFELGSVFKNNEHNDILSLVNKTYKSVTNSELEYSTENKVLILLDGLDEIPLKEGRDLIIKQIISLKENDLIQVVLASRTNDYISNDPTIEMYFDKFELLPINPSDIISLGEKILGNGQQFNSFVKMVKNGNLLKAFPKTPLTSILLAILFKEKEINVKELPKNVTELYRKFTDLFLNRWDKSRGISEQFKIQKKEFVLQTIAAHMQKNRIVSIKSSELEKFLEELAEKKPIGGPEDPKLHIKRLCERTNILIKNEDNDSYRFFHLTIQEYLAALKLNNNDDDLLVKHFYDEWWLNSNIFYAGNKTEYPEVLKRISDYEVYPADIEDKFNHIAHSSKVLLAAHNLDNELRKKVLLSMLKMFDEFSKGLIKELVLASSFLDKSKEVDKKIAKLNNQSLLDVILGLRNIFTEFFTAPDFGKQLISIWEDIFEKPGEVLFSDITLYCFSYGLSIMNNDARYLEGFVITDKIPINVRWYHIIEVDIKIRNMENTKKKIILKLKNGAHRNNDYIQKQFKERISRHYNSITGMGE